MDTYRNSGVFAVMATREECGVGMRSCHSERWEFMSWVCVEFEDTVKDRAIREGRLSSERVLAARS
jgi:hypothetical protein